MICRYVYTHKSYTPPDTIGALAGWLCIVSGIFHPSVDAQTGAVALGTGQQSLWLASLASNSFLEKNKCCNFDNFHFYLNTLIFLDDMLTFDLMTCEELIFEYLLRPTSDTSSPSPELRWRMWCQGEPGFDADGTCPDGASLGKMTEKFPGCSPLLGDELP